MNSRTWACIFDWVHEYRVVLYRPQQLENRGALTKMHGAQQLLRHGVQKSTLLQETLHMSSWLVCSPMENVLQYWGSEIVNTPLFRTCQPPRRPGNPSRPFCPRSVGRAPCPGCESTWSSLVETIVWSGEETGGTSAPRVVEVEGCSLVVCVSRVVYGMSANEEFKAISGKVVKPGLHMHTVLVGWKSS